MASTNQNKSGEAVWPIFRGSKVPHEGIANLPPAPPWRTFTGEARQKRGMYYQTSPAEVEMVNAALYLRRPLLITGKPGIGKSSIAYAVAYELGLSDVLVWPITTRATLQQALYHYDAIARLQDASLDQPQAGTSHESGASGDTEEDIGRYIRLGPLGTALLGVPDHPDTPRVLLIDEIDKSDIDLPNDLLHIFEEGEFEIPELSRLPEEKKYETIVVSTADAGRRAPIARGRVRCAAFPLVILTSNGEREFPPAFLRRCLRLHLEPPSPERLRQIVDERLKPDSEQGQVIQKLIDEFVEMREGPNKELATDQLLNAVYMVLQQVNPLDRPSLREALLRSLTEAS